MNMTFWMPTLLLGLCLSGCDTVPAVAPAIDTVAIAAATPETVVEKPKRIKIVNVIEHVTCDPVQAKKIQAEINAREAKRAQMQAQAQQ